MDIDVFVEIALLGYRNKKAIPIIKKISRIFRSVNILKKDIKDVQHDRENNIKTIVILVSSKNEINFSIYINNLLNLLLEKSNLIMKLVSQLNKKDLHFSPVYKFNQMIHEEKKEVLEIIQFLESD
jgi:hypothetical protein